MKDLLSLLLALSLAASAQVERFGTGVFGDNGVPDVPDYLEGWLGGSLSCTNADQAEFNFLNCNGGYRYEAPAAITNFDAAEEELVFLDATRRSHEFSLCQKQLFDNFNTNPTARGELFTNAWAQFDQSKTELKRLKEERDAAAGEAFRIRASMSWAEDRGNATWQWQNNLLQEALEREHTASSKLNTAIARIPLGNRPEVRDRIVDLLPRAESVTRESFYGAYRDSVARLSSEANASVSYFSGIYSQQGTNILYRVDENLKKTLTRTGQIMNTLHSNGTDARVARGFACRVQARYVVGGRVLSLVEIPFYFAGAYGLGRLALRAGVALIVAAETGAETAALAATSTLWAARAAMIGMDAVQWAKMGKEVKEACFPDNFFTAIQRQGGTCSIENEVNGVYQEAQIASCVSSAVIGLAPLAFVGGMRLWAARTQAPRTLDAPSTNERVLLGTATEADRPALNLSSELDAYLGTRPSLKASAEANPRLFRQIVADATEERQLAEFLRDHPDSAPTLEAFLRRVQTSNLTPDEAQQIQRQLRSVYRRQCPL